MQTIIMNKSRKFGKEILSFSRNYTFRRENFFPHPVQLPLVAQQHYQQVMGKSQVESHMLDSKYSDINF